ncbi:MAG: hypothetical protein IPQ16_07755 [Geobacteraceae bacterium]|nr:hypothetical protein [Geobacteraceae bacterium]
MKNRTLATITMAALMTVLLTFAGGAAFGAPLTPELAAKREMVRKQQAQRITDADRKAAADALKAERSKIYKAKQEHEQELKKQKAGQPLLPAGTETK